jgi:cytochrome c oxidase subunit 1
MMGLNGLSAILAATGGALYVIIVVASILFGKKVDASNAAAALGPMPKKVVRDAVAKYGNAHMWHLPGTYVLVALFFTTFVLYYFVNWKYLSELWPMR